jgi:site-specific DNA recombinase
METGMKSAAIYARVSSDRQREENTIASQTAALVEFAHKQGYDVPAEWVFEDEGFSGASLVRPALERLRDLAAEGQIAAILVYAPDRLSRKYAYQILLIEEFARNGVETIFVKAPKSATAEDQFWTGHELIIQPLPDSSGASERSRPDSERSKTQGGVELGCSYQPIRYVTLRPHPHRRSWSPLARPVHRSGQ